MVLSNNPIVVISDKQKRFIIVCPHKKGADHGQALDETVVYIAVLHGELRRSGKNDAFHP